MSTDGPVINHGTHAECGGNWQSNGFHQISKDNTVPVRCSKCGHTQDAPLVGGEFLAVSGVTFGNPGSTTV